MKTLLLACSLFFVLLSGLLAQDANTIVPEKHSFGYRISPPLLQLIAGSGGMSRHELFYERALAQKWSLLAGIYLTKDGSQGGYGHFFGLRYKIRMRERASIFLESNISMGVRTSGNDYYGSSLDMGITPLSIHLERHFSERLKGTFGLGINYNSGVGLQPRLSLGLQYKVK